MTRRHAAIAIIVALVVWYGRRNSRYTPRAVEKGEPVAALVKDRWSK